MPKETHQDETSPDQAEGAERLARMLTWARNSAAYRLSRRMLSEQQLKDQIIRKARQKFEAVTPEECEALADAAIAFGRDMGALDDVAYAEARTRSAGRQGKSRRAIAHALRAKGVEAAIADQALEEADDLRAAVILARKRGYGPFGRHGLEEDQRARHMAAFARNGFSYDLARRVVSMTLEEAEELLADKGFSAFS